MDALQKRHIIIEWTLFDFVIKCTHILTLPLNLLTKNIKVGWHGLMPIPLQRKDYSRERSQDYA